MKRGKPSDDSLMPEGRERVFAFWAGELGLALTRLLTPNVGVRVSVNPDVPGVLVFSRGRDVRICASRARGEEIGCRICEAVWEDFCSPVFWRNTFPELCESCVGPVLHFYRDVVPDDWRTPVYGPHAPVRELSEDDLEAIAEFTATLSPQEIEASGLDDLERPLWGAFTLGVLVAIASFDDWPNRFAHIGVATRPDYRGQKFAQAAVRGATCAAVARKRVAQMQCPADNGAAVGLADSLGYECFATTLLIHSPYGFAR